MQNITPKVTHKTVVFTKHARERMNLRNIGEDMIIQIMRNPSQTFDADDGKIKFIGKAMGAKIHAICKPLPDENKWIVITLWVRGENDDGTFTKDVAQINSNNLAVIYIAIVLAIVIFVAIGFYFIQLN